MVWKQVVCRRRRSADSSVGPTTGSQLTPSSPGKRLRVAPMNRARSDTARDKSQALVSNPRGCFENATMEGARFASSRNSQAAGALSAGLVVVAIAVSQGDESRRGGRELGSSRRGWFGEEGTR